MNVIVTDVMSFAFDQFLCIETTVRDGGRQVPSVAGQINPRPD